MIISSMKNLLFLLNDYCINHLSQFDKKHIIFDYNLQSKVSIILSFENIIMVNVIIVFIIGLKLIILIYLIHYFIIFYHANMNVYTIVFI